MTEQLQAVFQRVSELEPEIQNEFAASWLEELEDELLWKKEFSDSQDALLSLAKIALENHADGQTVEMDWDHL